jgi:hypothetical protein
MELNPYVSPVAELQVQAQTGGSAEVHSTLIDLLAQTKPWLRVVGVFMWIGVGLSLLFALGMLAMGALGGAAMQKANPMWGTAMTLGMSGTYFVLGLLYIYPTRRIWSSGSAIGRLMHSRSLSDLQNVLENQRSFWKFVGVSFLLLTALYVLILAGVMAAAVMSAAGRPAP